jgi:hypothetical protein
MPYLIDLRGFIPLSSSGSAPGYAKRNVWAPMTSAVRSNMRAGMPVVVVLNWRGLIVIIVLIVVSLRKASEADDEG